MTNSDETELSGEQRLKAKQRKFWKYLGIGFVAALFGGFASGYTTAMSQDGGLPIWVPIVALTAVAIGFVWFTYDYFRRIDEIDLLDNLWSHLFGMYAGVLTFMVWWVLDDLGLVQPISAFGVLAVMMVVTFLTYGARKLGFR